MLNEFIPNGLLPHEATSLTRVLEPDRWSQAEERTAGLIAHIQPNQLSEERRNAVASYVQRLITKCSSCEVFTFGSVPLKTYLPDGDIDLTAFSSSQNFKDSWAHEVQYILESEEKSEDAEFTVKEVQYIKAEVKIIKCLVDNIVVDISFNQLGGLCTLCFLEEVDNLISQNHLFKQSIILIKAWCYYESRILGAQHGLLSTYALETLVLYIFHVYNNTFAGPLEVLFRFLEFFSKFDWDNYCLSLWGPVPLGSLPNMRVEPPRKDCGELFLSKLFLDACTCVYAVLPTSQEHQEQPFVTKYFNIIDPLRANNNLGRSISKANFFRIRSAFTFGAQQLVRLLHCPEENLVAECDLFFRNTWDRHGKSHWLEAPRYGLHERNEKVTENFICDENEVERAQAFHASHAVYQQHANHLKESKQMFGASDVSAISRCQSQKTNRIFSDSVASDAKRTNSVKNELTDGSQGPYCSSNEVHAMCYSVGAYSSPEFAHTSDEVLPQPRLDGTSETERGQSHSDSFTNDNRKTSISRTKVIDSHNDRVSTGNQQSLQQPSYDWGKDDAVDSQNALDNSKRIFGLGFIKEDGRSSDDVILMHQEEHNFLNSADTFRNHILNEYLQVPVRVNSDRLYFPVPLPILASGYTHANSFDMLPANVIPSFDSFWGYHRPYSQSLVPFLASQSFPCVGMTSNLEEIPIGVDDNLLVADLDHDDQDGGFWSEKNVKSVTGYNCKDRNIKSQQQRDREMTGTVGSSSGDNFVSTIENILLTSENYGDDPSDETTIDSEANSIASSSSTHDSLSTSRNKLSSCSSLNGSPMKASKLAGDREIKALYPTPSSLSEGQLEVKQGNCSSLRAADMQELLPFTFDQDRPPVQFPTTVSVYKPPAESGTYKAYNSMFFDAELGNFHTRHSSANLDATARLKKFDIFSKSNHIRLAATMESSEKQRSNILNGDFACHWRNLQYGRLCQNAQLQGPLPDSPSFLHYLHSQGQFPLDVCVIPWASMNVVGSGSQLVPLIPAQHGSGGHVAICQHFADEVPRYSGGTGTYLPNPRFYRSRRYFNTRNQRGNYNYNRKDHHGQRERNWNFNSKPRFAGRGQHQYQAESPGTRMEKDHPGDW